MQKTNYFSSTGVGNWHFLHVTKLFIENVVIYASQFSFLEVQPFKSSIMKHGSHLQCK